MALIKCKECGEPLSDKAQACPNCGAPVKAGVKKPKKWHERTSVTLCVAAGLVFVGFGFIHVITGVTSPYELPFDIVLKESFGYRETFINAEKIISLPYAVAKKKYPISFKALQGRNYIESGRVFEARMTRQLRENIKKWQAEFERALNEPERQWQDRLLGRTAGIDIGSEDPNTYNNRGINLAREGRYEAAIAQFTSALKRDPAFVEACYNRGLVDLAIGQLGQAISDFTKTVEIYPEFIVGYESRAPVYLEMGRYEKAISDFTRIIESDPNAAETYFKRSLACYANGQYGRAREDVNKIQSLGLRVPSSFLARLRAALGNNMK